MGQGVGEGTALPEPLRVHRLGSPSDPVLCVFAEASLQAHDCPCLGYLGAFPKVTTWT